MWEVMAFGERPYWDMSGQDVSDLWLQLPDLLAPRPLSLPSCIESLGWWWVVVVVVVWCVCWVIGSILSAPHLWSLGNQGRGGWLPAATPQELSLPTAPIDA